jgi:hypothetical protein
MSSNLSLYLSPKLLQAQPKKQTTSLKVSHCSIPHLARFHAEANHILQGFNLCHTTFKRSHVATHFIRSQFVAYQILKRVHIVTYHILPVLMLNHTTHVFLVEKQSYKSPMSVHPSGRALQIFAC